jgi:hypothetical protein
MDIFNVSRKKEKVKGWRNKTPTLRTRSKGQGWGTLQKEGLRLARNMHRICIEWVKDIWTTHGICTECWDIWWPHGICMVWRRRLEGLNKWNITNPRYKGAHHTRNCSFFAHSTCLTSQPINHYGVNLDAPKKKNAYTISSGGAQYVTLDNKIKCLSLAVFYFLQPYN